MGERGEGNKVSGWEGLFSPRPSWLQESLGGHPSLASSDARQVCPFLHPEFHRSVRQHGEAKTLSGCPCELLHLQLYSKKPVIQWMRLLMQENPTEQSMRWCGETPSAGGQSGARYPLLESRNFHRILTEEVSQHLSPAVLRVLGVARGIQICQEDPRAPFRAARQLPDALFADLERNAYRVLGCQMHCLRRSFRQEVRVVDMLQSDGPCPCKMVASCSDSLYEHCKANALPSRSAVADLRFWRDFHRSFLGCLAVDDIIPGATGRWMARCWLHCAKGWPREATYDPDTAQIIAEEFVAHKFEVTDFTMKVLVDLSLSSESSVE
eukprot:g14074.t1